MYLPFSQTSKHTKTKSIGPEPQIPETVGAKVRLVNSSQEPKLIGRHEHLSQILPTEETSSFTSIQQGWHSGESTRLPPMWPGFTSRR